MSRCDNVPKIIPNDQIITNADSVLIFFSCILQALMVKIKTEWLRKVGRIAHFFVILIFFYAWHPLLGFKMSKISGMDIARFIEPIVEDQGLELVDVEFRREQKGWVLRLFIDRPEGVVLNDCADISGRVGAVLDVKDIIDVPYFLEVSSPGVDRPLRKEKDFQRFTGERISLKTLESINGQKNFKGQIIGLQEDKLLLLSAEGQELKISLDNIARAHVDHQWEDTAAIGHGVRSRRSRR